MILNFDDFKNRKDIQSDVVYLSESLSISNDVDNETRNVVLYLQNYISQFDNLELVENGDYEKYIFKISPKMNIFGCECIFNFDIINIKYNASEYKEFYRNNDFGAYTKTSVIKNGDDIVLSFIIGGTILLNDMKIKTFSKSIIEHELKHMYIHTKLCDGLKYGDYVDVQSKKLKYKNRYKECISILGKCSDKNYRNIIGKDVYKIIYTFYCCSLSEIAAFTQQAYVECENCSSEKEIYDKLEKSILFELKESFETTLKLIKNDDVVEKYDSMNFKHLPSIENLKRLFEKRYKKIQSNYGKLLVLLIDEYRDKNNIIDNYFEI